MGNLNPASACDWMYTTPAAIPYGFHISIIISICLNIAWLFLFDGELLLITSARMMMLTDYTIPSFSCHGLRSCGAWLNKYHNADLWLFRILVQDGVAAHATWGTLSALLNLTIYLQHQTETSTCDSAMLSPLLLLMELLAWFLLQNFYLDEHVRYIVTIYPVVILWQTGTLSNSQSPDSYMYIFAALILAISCILFVVRVALVTWRHHKRPLYKDSGSTNNGGHVVIHAGSIALAVIAQVISVIFFILAKDSSVPNALFQTSSRNVSASFPLEVTMDWWSENYCIMIDMWSMAWLMDAVASVCRRSVLGPESCNPEIHPPVFYQMWTTISFARMCSMLLWDRRCILGAVLLRCIQPVLSFYMLYMSYSNLNKHKAWLAINNPRVISWTRWLTQNGLAAFAWWSLLNAMLGLGIVLKYNTGVPDPPVSTIVLAGVSVCIVIWFILSLLSTKYMRYTFSVYAIHILGLGAMFTRSYRVHDFTANTVYCGCLMLLMTIVSLIHLVSACLFTDESRKPPAVEHHLKLEGCATVCQLEGNMKHKVQK